MKVDNDYRPTSQSAPLHLWRLLDAGELRLSQYEKIIQAINQLFEAKGFNKYYINFHDAVVNAKDFLYLTKYGDEIPWVNQRKLWKLNITPDELGETNPNFSEYGIVIWSITDNIAREFMYNPEHSNIQMGIPVPANQGGGLRRTRRHRRKAKRTRRQRRERMRK